MPNHMKAGLSQESVFNVSTRHVNRAGGEVKVASIDIEGPIGFDVNKYLDEDPMNDAPTIKQKLAEIGKDVTEIKVNILNSPGGDVYDGIAIHDFLASHPAKVVTEVTGFAASIATVIWQAGNERRMSSNSSALVHKGMLGLCGWYNENELSDAAADISRLTTQIMKVYEKRGVDMKKASPYIEAEKGNGTWIYPDEAKDMGLVDTVFEPFKAVAFKSMTQSRYTAMKSMFGLPDYPKMKAIQHKEPEEAVNDNNKEASTMTPEEIQALVTSAVTAAVAALKPQETAPEKKESPKMEVSFEGDFDNQEHLEAHALKLKKAQLYNATDFGDVDSVIKYQAALKKLTEGDTGQAPKMAVSPNAFNPTPVTDPQPSREADRADTLKAMGITIEGGK